MQRGRINNFALPDDPSTLLRCREVLALLRISCSCLYAGMAKGVYPRPIKIGRRAVAWKREEIERVLRNGVGGTESEVSAQ